jgi:hypothetical protein
LSISRSKARFDPKNPQLVVDALADLIKLEKDFEKIKVSMVLVEDYNLIDAFGILDVTGKGFVNQNELREALLDMGISCNADEANLVFERLNILEDG